MDRLRTIVGHFSPPGLEARNVSKAACAQPSQAHVASVAHAAQPPSLGRASGVVIPFPWKSGADHKGPYRYHDIHFHPTNYVQQGLSCKDALVFMDQIGIGHTVMSAIPTDQMGVSDGKSEYRVAQKGHASNCCGYYIHDDAIRGRTSISSDEYQGLVKNSPPLLYNQDCDAFVARDFQSLTPAQKNRFDCMITGLVLGDELCSEALLRKLDNYPGVFTGVGEITIHKEIVQDKLQPAAAQADLRPKSENIQPLKRLIQTCGDIGMPMVIHCDADVIPAFRKDGAEPLYFARAKSLFASKECSGTTIIWAHAAGAGKYAHLRDDHVERLDALLSDPALKHVNIDISWDTVAHQLTLTKNEYDPVKAGKWAALMEKHSDRVLFGSDSLAPTSHQQWNATAKAYEELLGMLSPEARGKIMKGNYERLIVAARPRVRAYEKHCLPHAIKPVRMRYDHPDLPAVKKAAFEALLTARLDMELELANGNRANARVMKAQQEVDSAAQLAEPSLPRAGVLPSHDDEDPLPRYAHED